MRGDWPEDYQAINELKTMAGAANYNSWIWNNIKDHIGNSILEIGAGIGTFTHYLCDYSKVHATDIADNCIEILKNRFLNHPNVIIAKFDITRISELEYWAKQEIDTMICLNVLEHIDDDLDALKNLYSIVCGKAKLILMVPAFQFAFGKIDSVDGHFRRYSMGNLILKLDTAGFSTLNVRYFNSIGLLAWYYTNKVVRNERTSPMKVRIYDKYFVPILSRIEGFAKPPFGQSIIAIAEKT